MALYCCAKPQSDLVIECKQITSGTQSNVLDTKAVIRAFFRRVLLGAQ